MSMMWLVRAPEAPADDAVWEWLSPAVGHEAQTVQHGTLNELGAAFRAGKPQPLTLLLSDAYMLVAPVSVPLRQMRQLQQALPFLLEENLAADIEQLHIVAGPRIDGGRLQVAAIERESLRALLAALAAEGINPELVTGEAMLLPIPAHGMAVLLDGANSVLATSAGNVLVFDQADAALVAENFGIDGNPVARLFVGTTEALVAARSMESVLAVNISDNPAAKIELDEQPRHRLLLLGETLTTKKILRTPANLRQGMFAVAGGSTFSPGFNWRPLAWLAACWAVLAMGYQVAIGISYARAADGLINEQIALYRQIFPDAKKVDKPRAQMQGQLRNLNRGGTTFSALVGPVAEGMATLEAAGGRFTSRTLAWDAATHQLRLDIVAGSLADIEQLRQQLQQKNLAVEIGSGVSQDGGYKARLNIGGGAR